MSLGTVARYVVPAIALWRLHRIEALLAVLGIVTGVGGLVAVVAVGNGARAQLDEALGALGTGTLLVRSVGDGTIGMDRALAVDRLLGTELRHRVAVAHGVASVASAGREVADAKIIATEREYAEAHGLAVAEGRFIAARDIERRERVCVLGAALAREVFPQGDALGSQVRLGPDWYTVIGVLAHARRLDESDALMPDANRVAFVPFVEASRFFALGRGSSAPRTRGHGPMAIDELLLRFSDEADMARAVAAVQRIVEYGGARNRFEYVMPVELIRQKYRMQRVVSWLLFGVTTVLLVVGGVSIANVMLMNVLRRRGEIGLRRAVGATRRAIVEQFLIEGAMVCSAGGFAGVLAGMVATAVLAWTAGWPVALLGPAAVLGFAASLLVGLAAASYPAWEAARIDPMRALS